MFKDGDKIKAVRGNLYPNGKFLYLTLGNDPWDAKEMVVTIQNEVPWVEATCNDDTKLMINLDNVESVQMV